MAMDNGPFHINYMYMWGISICEFWQEYHANHGYIKDNGYM